jgi:hypothetical protein
MMYLCRWPSGEFSIIYVPQGSIGVLEHESASTGTKFVEMPTGRIDFEWDRCGEIRLTRIGSATDEFIDTAVGCDGTKSLTGLDRRAPPVKCRLNAQGCHCSSSLSSHGYSISLLSPRKGSTAEHLALSWRRAMRSMVAS